MKVAVCQTAIVVAAALSTSAIHAQATSPSIAVTFERIDALVTRALATRRIAGATVSIVVDGKVAHERGFGVVDRESRRPVNAEETLFGLSSISKVFTTIALLQLVENGKVDLNSPARAYAGIPALSSGVGASVRISDLLTHTAGFDDRTIGIAERSPDTIVPLGEYLTRETPPIVRAPHTVASYSNHGFALAGLIVERVAQRPFADYMRTSVLAPLGMLHSGFEQPLPQRLETARAIPSLASGSQVPRIFFNDPPASAMYSTAGDMGRFMTAFLSSGTDGIAGVLASTRPMRERQFGHHAALNGLTFGLRERRDLVVRSIEQGGDWDDYSSDLILSPTLRLGLFVAFSGDAAATIADSAWKLLVAELAPPIVTAVDSPPASATRNEDIDGVYRLNRHSRHTLARLGVLTGAIRELRVEGGAMLGRSLIAQGDHLYRLGRDGQLLAFRIGPNGQASHLFMDSGPYVAYERVRWFERRSVHLAAFFGAFVVLGAVLWRAAFRWPVRPADGDALLRTWRAAMTVASGGAMLLVIGVAVTMATVNVDEFQYGLPFRLQALLSIGAVVVGGAVVATIAAALMWLRPRADHISRWSAAGGAITALTFAGLVLYWRLLPML